MGEAIYERDIRAQVEVDHDGEYVAVGISGGCWAVAEDLPPAANDLRSRHPDVLRVERPGRSSGSDQGLRLAPVGY